MNNYLILITAVSASAMGMTTLAAGESAVDIYKNESVTAVEALAAAEQASMQAFVEQRATVKKLETELEEAKKALAQQRLASPESEAATLQESVASLQKQLADARVLEEAIADTYYKQAGAEAQMASAKQQEAAKSVTEIQQAKIAGYEDQLTAKRDELKTAKKDKNSAEVARLEAEIRSLESEKAAAIQKIEKLKDQPPDWGLYTDGGLYTNFAFGAQFSNEYDEETGESEGLGNGNFAAQLNFDYLFPSNFEREGIFGFDGHHMALSIDFAGRPIRECKGEKNDEGECEPDAISPEGSFNDIKESLGIDTRWYWEMWQWDKRPVVPVGKNAALAKQVSIRTWSVGPTIGARLDTREELGSEGDSINTSYRAGVRVTNNVFRRQGHRNGLPRIIGELSFAHFEHWAGKKSENRAVFAFNYGLFKSGLPIYIGALGNVGSGSDFFAVFLSYSLPIDKFVDFLGPRSQ